MASEQSLRAFVRADIELTSGLKLTQVRVVNRPVPAKVPTGWTTAADILRRVDHLCWLTFHCRWLLFCILCGDPHGRRRLYRERSVSVGAVGC